MRRYELTFLWPNGDSTWVYEYGKDFHEAVLVALLNCPREARVQSVLALPPLSDSVVEIGPLLVEDADERGSEG